MNKRLIIQLILLPSFFSPCAAAESDTRETLSRALAEYRESLDNPDRNQRIEGFRRAHLLFQEAVASVHRPSAELLTNLGNAAAISQQPGEAIVAYRQALRVKPNHRRARTNLRVVRSELPEWVRYSVSTDLFDSLFFWNQLYTPRSITLWAALSFVLAALLVAASIRWQQSLLGNLAILPGIAWLVFVVSMAGNWWDRDPAAVVIADEVIGRTADSLTAAKFTSPIPSGTEVAILESRDDWTQIEFSNAQTAWVLSSAIQRLD